MAVRADRSHYLHTLKNNYFLFRLCITDKDNWVYLESPAIDISKGLLLIQHAAQHFGSPRSY